MAAPPKKNLSRGLPSIAQAREDRRSGGSRYRWTTQAGVAAAAVVVGGLIAWKLTTDREVNVGKEDLLKNQRAAEQTIGAEWFPLRDQIERRVVEMAGAYRGDFVDPELARWEFRSKPGIYLRLRAADAKDAAAIRKAAGDAKKDAFATCLLRESNERGARGEGDGGAFPEQPWNLGQAYAATRVLDPAWTDDVRNIGDEMRLRAFQRQYDKAVKEEMPVAARVVKQARFLLVALDEDLADVRGPDGGAATTEALQLVAHPVRIGLYDLGANKEMARLRREASAMPTPIMRVELGELTPAEDRAVTDPDLRAAMRRQVNNCALARVVQRDLWPAPQPATDGAPDGGPQDAGGDARP